MFIIESMKLSLTIKNGTLAGKVFELTEGNLTIGRSQNCGLQFDPFIEKIVSTQHAYIEKKQDGFYLTDFNSTNGTYLNGQKINTVKLKSGDTVQFGKNGIEAVVSVAEELNQSRLPTLIAPVSEETKVNPQISNVKPIQEPTAFFQPSFETKFVAPAYFQDVGQVAPNLRNSFSGLGMGAPVPPKIEPENNSMHSILIGIAVFAVIFLILIVATNVILPNLGFGVGILATMIAFMPAVFYLLPLIWLDRYDPEPTWLLGLAFAWGALISVLISYQVNTIFASIAIELFGPVTGKILTGVISAPIIEEATKGTGVLLILTFFRKYFDDILDGIVFGGTIALGFATVENIIYYGGAYIQGGGGSIVASFILRGIFSPFAHVTFTAMTGIGCGVARESHNKTIRFFMPIVGYFCAVFLHSLWNLMASILRIEGLFAGNWWYGYLLVQVPFFIVFAGFAFYVMYRQNKILKDMLMIDVSQGLIPEEHKNIATSAFRSTGWLLSGIFNGNFGARSKYLRAIGKLGLSYWHIQRAKSAQGETASFQQNPILRQEVLKWRGLV